MRKQWSRSGEKNIWKKFIHRSRAKYGKLPPENLHGNTTNGARKLHKTTPFSGIQWSTIPNSRKRIYRKFLVFNEVQTVEHYMSDGGEWPSIDKRSEVSRGGWVCVSLDTIIMLSGRAFLLGTIQRSAQSPFARVSLIFSENGIAHGRLRPTVVEPT